MSVCVSECVSVCGGGTYADHMVHKRHPTEELFWVFLSQQRRQQLRHVDGENNTAQTTSRKAP